MKTAMRQTQKITGLSDEIRGPRGCDGVRVGSWQGHGRVRPPRDGSLPLFGVLHELPVAAWGGAAELFEAADENGAGGEAAVLGDLLQGVLGLGELAAGMVDADGADGFGDALVGLLAENFGAAGGESGTMGVRFG